MLLGVLKCLLLGQSKIGEKFTPKQGNSLQLALLNT